MASAKAIAPRSPANQITICIFIGIGFFLLIFAHALNGNVLRARAPAQNKMDKIIKPASHICFELKTEVPMYANTIVSLI